MKKKIVRITTVPKAMGLLKGQLKFMTDHYEIIGISSSGIDHSTSEVGKKDGIEEIPSDHTLEQARIREGIRVIPVELTRKITPIKDLISVWQLYRIFKKEKPFIVHSHTPKAGTLGMLAAFLARVPHRLHTIAGMPLLVATGPRRLLLDVVEKITYKCATMIYPNSFGLKDIILEEGYTKESKLKVIGKGSSNGIDTSHFDPGKYSKEDRNELRKSLGIDDDDFVYLFVGRLVKDKGINELIQVFKELNDVHKKAKLVLVGPYEKDLDPLLPETEETINTHPNIKFVGWKNDVRPYFHISDVLTFPSYREGFPNVVMQSGAMGLPSIVTDINGCNEIVIEDENGLIVPPMNAKGLKDAMMKIYNCSRNDKLFDSDNNRQMIKDRYERRSIWKEILKEYQALN
ncbi:MAG: glycosyltransferase family 4 protein [Bacteroidia bacterium]|nr:glycosyltransferase family 4 protein [Bacteroidia bacterium]MBT8310541.1 glycosyltransferase family 4 protein [Bacteroidia bacterium]NND11258.1 glycosyltransferase family 4 protein [Flavobacteriaceae bacterium]NNK27336.1 glycosyltransferase family 4 protein [Flavobacteriaceae bacterium]NNL61460.1 glycosyltransferase family 4 protein [Flavobacteriaceae bacterium]